MRREYKIQMIAKREQEKKSRKWKKNLNERKTIEVKIRIML